MARRQSTGELRLAFGAASNPAAPTVAELNACLDLTPYLRRDGLTTPQAGNTIDISDVQSRFNKTAPGTYGGDAIEMGLYRDSVTGSDLAWSTLVRDATGNLFVRRFGGATAAWAASQKVEAYTGTVISREPAPIGDNEPQRFTSMFSIEATPVDGTVAA